MSTQPLERPVPVTPGTNRPLIAHLVPHPDRMVAICGARLRGILNPDGDVCIVCYDLAEGLGFDLTNVR